MKPLRCVIKRIRSRRLNRDLTVRMRSARFNPNRYNSFKYSTCVDVIRWTLSPRDPRAAFQCVVDPTPRVNPCHLHLKYCVELSPTQRILKKAIWFIRCDEYEGLASSEHGMLICT